MILRQYKSSDCQTLVQLFYDTVHTINTKDYTPEQLNVWATGNVNLKEWDLSLSKHFTIVAVINDTIVGFGDIDSTGYLDRLFVHKDFQNQGIATSICNKLEQAYPVHNIITHASITAKPFFTNRGYKTIKEQQVIRANVTLTNYIMEKSL